MPIYKFLCDNNECSHEEEHVVSMSEYDELIKEMEEVECPLCGSSLYRDFSPAISSDPVQINSNNIYEQVYEKRPDGSVEVMPAAKRLRDGNRKILPPPKDTWGKFRQ